MKYYKAEILLTFESFINDDPTQGFGPDSINGCEVVQAIKAPTLDQLKDKINKTYDLKLFKQFENRLDYSCVENNNERIPYYTTYSIYLNEVEETELDPSDLLKLS